MTLQDYINILKPEVEKLFLNDKSGHDISHLERTMKAALHIQKTEGGNEIIIGIAAFLHDVHRVITIKGKDFASPEDSLPIIEKMLSITNLDNETIEHILTCIKYHERYNWSDPENKNRSLETLILQDADNLDACGAMGIVRAFNYGMLRGIPMFDTTLPQDFDINYIEDHDTKESVIHYFYNKLFRLAENMNTKTGKKLAQKRVRFTKQFVKQFISEHECIF